jgi:hypothetical protein
MSIMSIGVSGMRAAEARFETAATRVTRAGMGLGDPGQPSAEIDMASELVSMTLATYDFKAAAKIVEVGRDMSRTVLDILA